MTPSPAAAACEIDETPSGLLIKAIGNWSVSTITPIDQRLRAAEKQFAGRGLRIDMGGLSRLDSAGAWLLSRTEEIAKKAGARVSFEHARPEHNELLQQVRQAKCDEPMQAESPNALFEVIRRIGAATRGFGAELIDIVAFLGSVMIMLGRAALNPRRLRLTATVHHMEKAGLDALPLIALLTFLVGAVLAQQGAVQLQAFGAEVYTVNLVTITFLREVGILLTAIIVAGRSGSAFAAEIGSMKMREEIDAMRTLGLDPTELLIMPRVLALTLTLPLLTFVADVMGLIGGGVVVFFKIGMAPEAYLQSVRDSADLSTFLVGIIKAPFMAVIIVLIACRAGTKVEGSAESVGLQTTNSVVRSIFAVIVLDALFAILFTQLGI